MTVSVVVLYTRRPDLSIEEFKSHMEQVHIPIIKEAMGVHYPITHLRKYVERVRSGAGDRLGAPASLTKKSDPVAPVVLVGSPNDLGWDLMAEMIYRDELHMQQGYATINSAEGQRIFDDEENFTVREQLKVVLVGEVESG